MKKDEPDIFADALASQIDAIRRAAFDECIALVPQIERRFMLAQPGEKIRDIIEAELIAARDATSSNETAEDRGKKLLLRLESQPEIFALSDDELFAEVRDTVWSELSLLERPSSVLMEMMERFAAHHKTQNPRSDKGKHHHVAGVLQEDVDEAEN